MNGIAERLVEPYFESFPQREVFAAPTVEPAVMYVVRRHDMVTYDQIRRLRFDHLTRHLGDVLFKNGIGSHIIVKVRQSRTAAALMGVFDPEPGAFTPVDLRLTALVGRHLGNLIRWHTDETSYVEPLFSQQVTVTNLLVRGFTIREIAGALDIGVDTVKKYIAQVLRVTGCRSRTQLALAWQQGFDQAITHPAD
ncbi:helix-turn-helix transcriptional regulator [Nocardia sp. CA-107356]|uniref:helix-turn-helix transcriptional regulator n=1 Tax=Nocardia sp. CA-107356 TaxID=3239972 RepID=UPI003D9464C8